MKCEPGPPATLPVDELVTWKQLAGDRRLSDALAKCGERGWDALPLAAKEMSRLFPNLWVTKKAAKRWLEKEPAQAQAPGGGLIALPDSFNNAHCDAIVAAAARHSLPLIGTGEFSRAGGLMSYTSNGVDLHAQAASYIDRILRGATPAELPVQQPTKYSLVINLKAAKALGLTVPLAILARADEVIE